MTSIEWLLLGILAVSVVRFVVAILDHRQINKLNAAALQRQGKALEYERQRNKELDDIRRQELQDLSEMAKTLGQMEAAAKAILEAKP